MTVKRADSVFEQLIFEGEWYFPETPDIRCHGTIKYDIAGANHLQLWGSLGEERKIGYKYSVIHGIIKGGAKVTIFDAGLINLNESRLGGITYHSKIYFLKFWVGEHFKSISDVKLESFSFGINNLENWHNLRSFSSEDKQNEIFIKYVRPSKLLLFEDDYVEISLYYELTYRNSIAQVSADLEHVARINISVKQGRVPYYNHSEHTPSIEYYFNHVRNFFWIVIGREIFTYCHEARVKTIIKTVEELRKEHLAMADKINKKLEYPLEVEYYWARSIEFRELKKRHVEEMVFPFEFIQNDIKKLMKKWFEQRFIINVAIDSYIGFCNRNNSYTKATLSLLIYAVEGLHRKIYPELDEKHEKKAINLVSKCPSEIREEVERRIMSWCPLQERLHKLLKEYKIVFPEFYKKRVEIVDNLKNLRNNISHAKGEKDIIDFNLQFVYARFLSLLLAVMFMDIAGMEKKKIAERFVNLTQLCEMNNKIKNNSVTNHSVKKKSQHVALNT